MEVSEETYREGAGMAKERRERERRVADGGKSNLPHLLVTRSFPLNFLALNKVRDSRASTGSSPLFAHTGSPFPTKYKTVISKKFPQKIKKIKSDFKCTASVTRFSGYAVSLTEHTYTHKGVGGEQGCGGGEVGVQGEENRGVCAYHGGRRQSGPHTCFYTR